MCIREPAVPCALHSNTRAAAAWIHERTHPNHFTLALTSLGQGARNGIIDAQSTRRSIAIARETDARSARRGVAADRGIEKGIQGRCGWGSEERTTALSVNVATGIALQIVDGS